MSKTLKPVTVNFNTDPPTCAPDPVHVSRASNSGIDWSANKTGFTFTGVKIKLTSDPGEEHAAPWGDFGTPVITNKNGKSDMTVTDGGTDYDEYTYSLEYIDADGNPGSYDPRIKNEQ